MRSLLLAFVAGIWLLQQQAVLPSWFWFLLLLPLFAAVLIFRRHTLVRRILALVCALMLGFFWAAAFAQYRLADTLPQAWEGEDIDVVGVVAELPKSQERSERFAFDVEQVLTPQAKVPSRISLSFYAGGFRGKVPTIVAGQFHPGERWRFTVRLKRPHGSYNPGGFDFEAWALERNIRAVGYLKKNASTQRLAAMVWSPQYVVERLREKARDRLQTVLNGRPYEGVLRALAIGDESGISRADWQVFLRTGVNHLVSISGLHVTMVSGLIYALVYGAWRRVPKLAVRLPARKAAVVAGCLTALGYALLAGFSVPTQRTVYMLAVVAAALWSSRNISISLVLSWAVFATVLIDPWAVLSPGFWLSFGAVAVMVFAGDGRLGRPKWLHEAIRTQWAVTIGLAPLLLVLFQQVSVVSPVANAFAIPVVSLIVVPLTLLGAIIPVDAILLVAHQVMAWCMTVLQFFSAMPSAVWQQHAPPVWTLPLAMAGMLWMLLPWGFPSRWLGLPACLPIVLIFPSMPPPGQFRAAVLDVGQGLSVVVQTSGHALLYDAGPRFGPDSDSGSWTVVPYLRSAGIQRLDGFIVSHNDEDHSGGAASVLDALPVGWFASSLPPDEKLMIEATASRRCFAGQVWEWDDVRFEMLHPQWESYGIASLKDNARSCVLKVTGSYGSLLIPGDIERDAEAELEEAQPQALKADVLIPPHHGSKTSSTQRFLDQVRPSVVVFAAGYRNRFGHPKPEVVERYRDLGSQLYRSDRDGMVMLDFGREGVAVQTWRQARPRYWLAESTDAR